MIAAKRLVKFIMTALAAVVAVEGLAPAAAQQSTRRGMGATVERSALIENLFKQAQQGIDRQDWKLAVDSLQRILDHPQGAMIEKDAGYYESARNVAERRLAKLPPEGLAAYRVLNDGRADRLLKLAIRDHAIQLMEQVVDRYLLTSSGPRASMLLTSWLLDNGQAVKVIRVLDRTKRLRPQASDLQQQMALRKTVAHAMLSQRELAIATAHQARGSDVAWPREQLQDLIASLPVTGSTNRTQSEERPPVYWPMLGGGPERRGQMAEVSPTLAGRLTWSLPMPDSLEDDWVSYLASPERGFPPTMEAIAGDGLLFVNGQGRCAAIHLDTFQLAWASSSLIESLSSRFVHQIRRLRGQFNRTETLSREERIGYDYAGQSLCLAGDLLLTIESAREDLSLDDQGTAVQDRARPQLLNPWVIRRAATDPTGARRLVAYEAKTGNLRWVRGASADPQSLLYRATFLGVPLPIKDELWCAVLADNDLFVVGLDRATGQPLHRIYLCTPIAGMQSTTASISISSDGAFLYIPTGQGLLFCVDLVGRQLNWAVRYERSRASQARHLNSSNARRHSWRNSPPIIAGGILLLAPPDSDALIALDRTSGLTVWRAPRGHGLYLIAAGPSTAWLGGPTISCVSLATGDTIWRSNPVNPTGRAVLGGNQVLVPTAQGLLVLDAASGSTIDQKPLPAHQPPLGNLLIVADGLISADGSLIRRYPDADRAYRTAAAAHQADPTAPAPSIRLASLELMDGDALAALEALDDVQFNRGKPQFETVKVVGALRVDALLQLAAIDGLSLEKVGDYLRRAVEQSITAEDQLRTGLALAAHLEATDQLVESYTALWELGRDSSSNHFIEPERGLRIAARSVIAEKLNALESRLPVEALSKLQGKAEELFLKIEQSLGSSHKPSESIGQLRNLAAVGGPGHLDQRALLALATWQEDRQRFEPAEQNYLAAIHLAKTSELTAQGHAQLAAMYLNSYQQLPVCAEQHISSLHAEFGDVAFPWITPEGRQEQSTGAQAAQALRSRINQIHLRDHQSAMKPGAFSPDGGRAWGSPLIDSRTHLVSVFGQRPEAMAGRMLTISDDDVVRAYRLVDGKSEWEAELRLADDVLGFDRIDFTSIAGFSPFIATDGQTAFFRGPSSLHAVGLVSGKRLWAIQQFVPPRPAASQGLFAAEHGLVASMPEEGIIAVLSAANGTPRWQRRLEVQSVVGVRILEDRVVVFGQGWERADIFDLSSGHFIGSMTFHNTDLMQAGSAFARAGNVLCGPDGSAAIAYDLADGSVRWRLPVPNEMTSIFKLNEGLVGVGSLAGRLSVVDAQSGELVFETLLADCRNGITDGTLEGGTMVIGGMIDADDGRKKTLVGLDFASRRILWQRDDLANVSAKPWYFGLAAGTIPAMIHLEGAPARRQSRSIGYGLAVIDARTGQDVGVVQPFDSSSPDRFTGNIAVWPGRLIIGMEDEIYAVPTEPTNDEERL